jgi:hypothetical protein
MRPAAISATERNILDGATLSTAELNYNDITTLGTAEASKTLTVDANKRLIWTTTSDVTVNPLSFISTMTGAGSTGGRAYFELNTEVALGGWANALKALTDFGSTGRVSGLGSALVAEIVMGAGTTQGTYAPLESELVFGDGALTGTATSFLYCNVSGNDVATFNAAGYLFELGAGITSGTDDIFEAEAKSGIAKTHTLRIKVAGVNYFIALHTAKAFGGS